MSGKGDGRRPTLVSEEEAERRWREAFGSGGETPTKPTTTQREPDDTEIDWSND
jgi:hypothetical protein